MIGNFEPKKADVNLNVNQQNFSDLTGAQSVLFCDKDTSLTKTEALTLSNWISLVADGDMFPVHHIRDVQDDSEETFFQESLSGFRYKLRDGKVRFNFLVNVDEEFYPELLKLQGQNLKAYFFDRNSNMLGVQSGSNFNPFTLDQIIVRKIDFGKFNGSFVGISVEFALQSEIQSMYRFKPDWHANAIRNELVTFSTVTETNLSDWESIYGYLYNWYAVADARGIANGDYDVPTDAEWTWLEDYIDAEILAGRITATGAGGALKETGTVYWLTPNTGATNELGFNGRGSGLRYSNNGLFDFIQTSGYFWSTTINDATTSWYRRLNRNSDEIQRNAFNNAHGMSVRLIRPATPAEQAAHNDGDFVEIYTGNDGKEYGTIYVGKNDAGSDGYVILSSNLAETEFANSDPIPNTTDAVEWVALTTAGRCAYDNLEANAGTGGVYTGIEFTITDRCGNGVEGILAADLSIVDNIAGALTIDEFHDLGDGEYFLNTTTQYYNGKITLKNDNYNGAVDYSITVPEFNPTEFSSDFKIT